MKNTTLSTETINLSNQYAIMILPYLNKELVKTNFELALELAAKKFEKHSRQFSNNIHNNPSFKKMAIKESKNYL